MDIKYLGLNRFILLVLVSVLAAVVSIFLFLFSKKGGDTPLPQEILLSNITDSSATISFTTEKKTSSFVFYGKEGGKEDLVGYDARDKEPSGSGKYFNHFIRLSGLESSSPYSFRIMINGKAVSKGAFRTGPLLSFPSSLPFFGRVIDKDDRPVSGMLLTIIHRGESQNSLPLSTLTQENGSFTFNAGNARLADLSAYALTDPSGLRSVEVTVKYGTKIEEKKVFSSFNTSALGGTQLEDIVVDLVLDNSPKKESLDFLKFRKAALAADSLSFGFLSPGRWDIVVYNQPSENLSASLFLRKLSDKCGVSAYWMDRLADGAWESFILRNQGYGFDFPVEYTKGYFVVVEKANPSCLVEI